jgi:hypothetical protein
MLRKLFTRFGKRSVALSFCLVSGLAAGQDKPAKQKAIQEMRQIANAVKQCPVRKTATATGGCQVASSYIGPPTDVEWDVLPSKTARSPFQGVLEFSLPSYRTYLDRDDLSAKEHQKCVDDKQRLAKIHVYPFSGKSAISEVSRRYEFDLGPGAPELVKILQVSKDNNNNDVTSAVTDGMDADACWITTAKAGGMNKTESAPSTPKP